MVWVPLVDLYACVFLLPCAIPGEKTLIMVRKKNYPNLCKGQAKHKNNNNKCCFSEGCGVCRICIGKRLPDITQVLIHRGAQALWDDNRRDKP